MLTPDQRSVLLDAARRAIADRLERGVASPRSSENPDEVLAVPRGVFVSLHLDRELRGCIGVIEPRLPLLAAVTSCAISAAFEDPRFGAVRLDELDRIRIEISVLSPPRRVGGPNEIRIGTDGVIVACGGLRGLLLPQVAPRMGWGIEELLDAACLKAGLTPSAWREPRSSVLELSAFSAEVFGETEA